MVASPDEYRVEALCDQHNRHGFECGKETLDSYIREQIENEVRANSARAFVLVGNQPRVVGFYTLSNSSIRLDLLSKAELGILPEYPTIPTTLLGRFAIDTPFQRQGLGTFMLVDALKRSWEASRNVGSWAVFVDTHDDDARAFYTSHEFVSLLKQPAKLYLPMSTLTELFEGDLEILSTDPSAGTPSSSQRGVEFPDTLR